MATLAGLIAVALAMAVVPASASAACPMPSAPTTFSTSWNGGSGHYNNDANWSNGVPTVSCDASITAAGTYTVTMNAGSNAKSMTIGGAGSNPTLQISAENANTNLLVVSGALSIASGASLTLICNVAPPGCGAPNVSAPTISNAGTFTVDATVNGMPFIGGQLTNTGTMQFNHTAKFNNGAVTNQGTFNIADGVTVLSGGSSCGDTGVSFKNDTGGTLNAAGTGTFDVINYEQGAGSTSGASPVQIPCGTLKYTGNGASTVTAYGGFGLTGAMQAGQSLTVTNNSSNTNAVLGGNFTSSGSITLTCPTSSCNGPGFNIGANSFTNAGTFTVAAPVTTAGSVSGNVTNTGTMQFNGPARFDNGAVTNQGTFNIADGVTVVSSGSSCGDTGVSFKNDTGGTLNATGAGTLSAINYEQGAGSTSGTSPVQIPCGTLKYTGSGASKVQANGGFTLTGEMQAGQSLAVNPASSNTNATLGGNFTNKGAIALTCLAGCSGGSGGAGFNVNDKDFVNAGTFTVAAVSGTGASVGANFEGTITNTGTMQFDQSAGLGGPVVNKGPINIANGKTVTSSGSSCGDTGASVKNDTGGQINATGTGTLSVLNYEQGAGTTSGSVPVQIPCGTLKYTGNGASVVQAGGPSMTGNVGSAQTLRIVGGVSSGAFTNAGTIVFDQSASSPTLNVGTTLTNTGTITTSGPSANTSSLGGGGTIDQTGASAKVVVPAGTNFNIGGSPLLLKAGQLTGGGTLTGSVNNSGGVVAPGASPGTLTLSGNYTQASGGRLDIEIDGTGAGQFDKLVVGGNATLGGTLAFLPSPGYAAAAAIGDSIGFLAYGGTRTNPFGQTTVNPAMACPKQLAASYSDGAKAVNAVVSNSGASCGGGGGGGGNGSGGGGSGGGGGSDGGGAITDPPPPPLPETKLGTHPPSKVKTTKSKAKVRFAFSSDLAGAKFECELDKGKFKPCKSPKSYKVKPGKHKFSVRAIGSDGAADSTPASFRFKVIREKR